MKVFTQVWSTCWPKFAKELFILRLKIIPVVLLNETFLNSNFLCNFLFVVGQFILGWKRIANRVVSFRNCLHCLNKNRNKFLQLKFFILLKAFFVPIIKTFGVRVRSSQEHYKQNIRCFSSHRLIHFKSTLQI